LFYQIQNYEKVDQLPITIHYVISSIIPAYRITGFKSNNEIPVENSVPVKLQVPSLKSLVALSQIIMESEIIETRNLSYQFGNQLVLDQVSLNVREGSIYGFLGPNGAGKTTTIKVLLNLLQIGEDKVFLFGKDLNKNRVEILSGIGSN
jgi:ABC-type multidrug transport system fused ATPase/permease subunit